MEHKLNLSFLHNATIDKSNTELHLLIVDSIRPQTCVYANEDISRFSDFGTREIKKPRIARLNLM